MRILETSLRWMKICLLLISIAFISQFISSGDAYSAETMSKKAWIAKAARFLRYKKPIRSHEMIQLLSQPKDEIVKYLMDDPSFSLTVLDFISYYLGDKKNGIDNNGFGLSGEVRNNLQLMHGAISFFRTNNFESIYQPYFPNYSIPP